MHQDVGSAFDSRLLFISAASIGVHRRASAAEIGFSRPLAVAKTAKQASNRVCSIVEQSPFLLTDEYRSKILRLLEEHPEISQRELARELGVSLGKVNYCLQALMEKGLVKAANFKNSNNKKAYMYFLTRRGIAEKARATTRFLDRKMTEYEALRREIESLRREMSR
jgi:EPS-associated MarR family transcriptional regulator